MPLKCSTASYQFRCHDGAYLFSAVVDFISNFIFVSCQGKLRFEVSFIVFGCDNEVSSAEKRELRHFQMEFCWSFLTIRMVGRARGHKPQTAESKQKKSCNRLFHAYHVGLLWFLCFDVPFMQRKWFSPTTLNKQKENSCNFFISARDNCPRPEKRPEKRTQSSN